MSECAYCGDSGNFLLKNGKWCCKSTFQSCPTVKGKNSEGLRKAHADGLMRYDQFIGKREWNKGKTAYSDSRINSTFSGENIFTDNTSHSNIRSIVLKEKLLPYKCQECGLESIWNGKLIILELDHIDGNGRNHELTNLRFLCPNCHSQTPTYKSGNLKHSGKKIVTDDALIEALKTTSNIRQALMSVGLTAKGANYHRAYKLKFSNNITQKKDK